MKQGSDEQLQLENDFDSLNVFDKSDESILKPLPECTAQLDSDLELWLLPHCKFFSGPETHNSTLNDPLLLHRMVHESCRPNYMGIQVPVSTNFTISNWRHLLVD